MHATRRVILFAAFTVLAAGGCELRCNGPVVIIPTRIKYGGRAVAIATHPADDKSAFVVSESGGIFRTRNFGSPWFQVSGKSTFWFSDVHYFDANPDIIIATAFEDMKTANSGGVWRSTNGGDTWTHIAITPPDTSRPFEAYCIAVERSEPARIWVGTSAGLAFSDDQGVTWAFTPWANNFGRVPVWSVIAPSPGHLRVVTLRGFRSSDDRGATWRLPMLGFLPHPFRATHNQLACSPASDDVVYWCGVVGDFLGRDSTILIRSQDGGIHWTTIKLNFGNNRDAFIRVTPRAISSDRKYQIYFGDGSSFLGRAEVDKGNEQVGGWQTLAVEHVDLADIGFKDDGFTPWLLAGDGGLQTTTDKGAHWKMAGNGADGYAALQISDATGQTHGGNRQADLYFGTQDNSFWASGDNGQTWPYSALTEGVHLNVGEQASTGDHNRVNFILGTQQGLFDMISDPLLSNPVAMNVPHGDAVGARRLADRTFMRPAQPVIPGSNPIWVTHNNGGIWFWRCEATGFVETRDRIQAVDVAGEPVVFFAVGRSVDEKVIMRATGLTGNGTPLLSTVTGYGRTGFALAKAPSSGNPLVWEALYAVDPFDPDHLLVVDDRDSTIKVTHDGGASWTVDQALVARITNRGMYRFRRPLFPLDPMNQVTVIAFDPHTRGRVLVGTVQAGVIFSCDFGQSWRRLEDSENIPNVSSFYFTAEGWVLASSYGRGLWRLSIPQCPPSDVPPVVRRTAGAPFVYASGALFLLASLEVEPKLTFAVARGGEISGYHADSSGRTVERIEVKSGTVEDLSMTGASSPATVPVVPSGKQSGPEHDPKLAQLVKEGLAIKGVCLEGRQFRGYLLAKNDVVAADLPRPRIPGPAIAVTVSGNAPARTATIAGARFEPGKLEILVNEQLIDNTRAAGPDGTFRFEIPVSSRAGRYVLTVRQIGAHGPIEASAPYEIVNAD